MRSLAERLRLGSVPWRTVIAWLIVLPWVVWGVVRVFGLERGWPVVQLMAFTPYVVAVALVAGIVTWRLERTLPTVLAAATVVALATLIAPRVLGDDVEARAGGPQLRVLSANAHLGRVPPRDLVALVRRTAPDVLVVQELTPRLADGLERAGLSRLLPRSVVRPGPRHGTGIYARVGIEALPPFRGVKSAMAAAALTVPGGPPVRIVSVHVAVPLESHDVADWRADLRRLPGSRPVGTVQLLAGDFNATLDHEELRRVIDRGYRDAAAAAGEGLRPTWRKRLVPPVTLDHVLVPERCGVLRVGTYDLPGSDHRAVYAVLALPGPQT
jgi:endonuclease/exonuclease/phosphatase (EEP) superfamily protein YafD